MDTGLRDSRRCFKLGRGLIAEGGVAALPIIKHFEIFKDLLLGLVSCEVLSMMNEFPFQGAKEALDAGVVPAIAFAAHASRDTVRGGGFKWSLQHNRC